MFCRFCGSELRDEDKFCSSCGNYIGMDNNSEEKQGMKWYNFYTYFWLPFSLIISIILIFINFNKPNFGLLMSLIEFIYIGITFAFLIYKKKIGYYMNIILVLLSSIINYFSNYDYLVNVELMYGIAYTIGFLAVALPWDILNIIYFCKRKKLFE